MVPTMQWGFVSGNLVGVLPPRAVWLTGRSMWLQLMEQMGV